MRFKIILFLTFAGLALSVPGFTQPLQLGPEAGVAYNLSYQEAREGYGKVVSRQFSWRAGVPVVLSLGSAIRLHTGLYYAAKGISGTPPVSSSPTPFLTYSALELPMAFTWNKADEQHNSFFIGAGPYIGLGIRNKMRWNYGPGMEKETSAEWGRDLRRFDWGAQLQLGYEFRSGWVIRMLAQRSFANMGVTIDDSNSWNPKAFAEVRNKGHLALSIAYLFRFRSAY
jgi:hypothetical protein